MILQSDGLVKSRFEGEPAALPVRLLGTAMSGGKDVARLQFESLDLPWVAAVSDRPMAERDVPVVRVEEERAAQEAQVQGELERVAIEIEAARAAGRMEARRELEGELAEKVEEERLRIVLTCERFKREREGYFAAVEAEVVKLALAIAARVLQREVKLDPMLLQAVVKVALAKAADESGVVLRVPVQDEEAWRGLMEADEAKGVEVTADSRLKTGECVLETSIGRVELGVAAQLAEIERGFFDLLQLRPA